MSTNHTTNYALNQWEATDKVLRTEFNADNAKIDAALKANADAIAALGASKADLSALEALAVSRNCQLYVKTYTGTGQAAITHTFPHKPAMFLVMSPSNGLLVAVRGCSAAQVAATVLYCETTWSGNSVTLAYDSQYGGNEGVVGNYQGRTYVLTALLELEE